MAAKTIPVSFTGTTPFTGTTATTFTASITNPYLQEAKQGYNEACVVINVGAMTGSSVAFDLDEFFDGNWIHVGTTGSLTTTGAAVIDSLAANGSGGSTGSATFTASSNLRALGKGTDTRLRVGVAGVFGTLSYTADYIGYSG